jgi:subtilisin family serine protease
MLRESLIAFGLVAAAASPAQAQEGPVRLAAPADCRTNPNCAPGLKRAYGSAPPASALVRLTVADAGIEALDDGIAEVAVAFSSDPGLSRPDIKVLRDDKRMIGPDHIVPVVRSKLLERYGAGFERRLNAASRLLNTLALRGLNQQVIDGRLPEAVGGEFVDANGLGGSAKRKPGPRIVVGYQAFAENETLAHLYAEALRAGGYRVRVRAVGGLRREAVAALRRGRIGLYPAYSGSLREDLGGRSLRRALARLGAEPLRRAQAQNRNVFAIKTETARRLSVNTLSDLTGRWRAAHGRFAAEPLQDEQWAFSRDSVLDMPGAWSLTLGAGAVVAIVDSGTKLDHPDLAPNIWANFREVPGNGVDDDGNGYVDDVYGIDLSSKNPGQNLSDGHGHGTHVAGIVAAAANRRGVVGVAPRAKLMTVRVLDNTGAGTTGAVAEGIRYAAANGARVINASIQGDFPDPNMEAAIAAAGAANALVVVSAGNSARDIDAKPSYPAAIAAPNLISVAATAPDEGTDLDSYSNYGRLAVGLAAPGGNILATTNDGGYGIKSGTSMAAPMVAGIAALMVSLNPGLSASELRARLLQHAGRASLPVAAGYVDARASVRSVTTAVGQESTQRPRVRILRATADRRRTQLQVAVSGSRRAIKRYKIKLDNRSRWSVKARRATFTVALQRRGRRVRVTALSSSGRTLASARQRVKQLRAGKRGVTRGRGVGT